MHATAQYPMSTWGHKVAVDSKLSTPAERLIYKEVVNIFLQWKECKSRRPCTGLWSGSVSQGNRPPAGWAAGMLGWNGPWKLDGLTQWKRQGWNCYFHTAWKQTSWGLRVQRRDGTMPGRGGAGTALNVSTALKIGTALKVGTALPSWDRSGTEVETS